MIELAVSIVDGDLVPNADALTPDISARTRCSTYWFVDQLGSFGL
jgi:hypothetical protein